MTRLESSNGSIYSFVAWIATIFAYIFFLGWALLPENVLHGIGITYYPSRYYAIAFPAYVLVLYIFILTFYVGLNLFNTLEPENLGTVGLRSNNNYVGLKEGIPEIGDIDPIAISFAFKK
jgi:hypothetical protein